MYKKKKFSSLSKKYSSYQDTGSVGMMMKICHTGLDDNRFVRNIGNDSIILEIGAGSSPHFEYLKHSFKKYFFLENSIFSIKYLKKKYKKNKKIYYKYYKNKNIPFKNNYFDRIIISHVLEHIPDPEFYLDEMFKKLKKNGIMSIALPSDPALLWRIGRFFLKIFKVKKKLKISKIEYDYMIATEHINSIFNLLSIIRFKYKKNIINEQYLPFKIKLLDLNLFYNVTIKK